MTEAEVRGAWPGAQEREENGGFLLRLDGPTAIGGVTYENVRFVFDTKGKLREVRLEIAGPFDALRERLALQLGAPVNDDDKPLIAGLTTKSAVFRDLDKGNTIRVWSIQGGRAEPKSYLTYRALEAGF